MKIKPIKVLMIGDNEEDSLLIKDILHEANPSINLQCCRHLEKGLTVLSKGKIDVVLLASGPSDSESFETFDQVCRKVPDIPIIVLTGPADKELQIEYIRKGAQDYLIKGQISSQVLKKSIQFAVERKRAELELLYVNRELRQTIEELKEDNRKIQENQKSLIQEERFKALLEMSGTTCHELNQPLTSLLGNIELMKLRRNDPEKLTHYINIIENSGKRIADIVKKINEIRHDDRKSYIGNSFIINIHQEIKLLLVEVSDYDYEKIYNLLKDNEMIILYRASGIREAIEILKEKAFDLIILNYLLPEGNGFDFLKIMKKKEIDIPVIVNAAHGDESIASRLIKEGAYDYITKKNISQKSLHRCITNALEKFRLKREIKLAREKIAKLAARDELTGLYNYQYFMEIFEREVERAKRYKSRLVFCMIDLDHFKRINDTYGHFAGDMVLSEIGKILTKKMRLSDLVCRFGGEEFAVILPSTDIKKAELVCERLRKIISKHQFEFKSSQFMVTTSVGIAIYNKDTDKTPTFLLKKAEQALYQAKNSGRNQVVVYNAELLKESGFIFQ